MTSAPGGLEPGDADRQQQWWWWTLHSQSLEILAGGAWRVMATLTTHQTLGLVELRLAVDPSIAAATGWCCGGGECWIAGPPPPASGPGAWTR